MKTLEKFLILLDNVFIIIMLVAILFLIFGCTPLTAEQIVDRDYRNDITREMYYVCKDAWSQAGLIWVEDIHFASGRLGRELHPFDMRSTLSLNGCGRYLKSLGY